jgi:hypothetical protein
VDDGEVGIVELRRRHDGGDVQVHDNVADCFVSDEMVAREMRGVFESSGREVEVVEFIVVEKAYNLILTQSAQGSSEGNGMGDLHVTIHQIHHMDLALRVECRVRIAFWLDRARGRMVLYPRAHRTTVG